MPNQNAIEAELLAVTQQFMETWFSRADDALECCYALIAPDMSGFGTGADESANNREEFMLFLQHEHETLTQLGYYTSGENVQVLNETAALVQGYLTIEVPVGGGETVPVNYRFTYVYRQTDGRWQVANVHISRPDTEQPEGEAMPVDAVRARNLELERLVAERTAELEAARREAEVEAALERIRSRSMAMQESSELGGVIQVVFREALQLGLGAKACDLVILDEITGEASAWISGERDENGEPLHFKLPRLDHPHYTATLNAWKDAESVRHTVLEGEVCVDYMRQLTAAAQESNMPDDLKAFLRKLRFIIHTDAYIRHGYIRVASTEALDLEAVTILQRIGQVFEQTYTRFLDLKKAEEQVREAQIEAALERVRTRTTAMRQSEDLGGVVEAVFEEMERLSFAALRCGIGIIDEANRSVNVWTTTTTDEGNVVQVAGDEALTGHPLSDAIFDFWKRQEHLSYLLEDEELVRYYEVLTHTNFQLPVSVTTAAIHVARQYYYCAMFPAGGLYAFQKTPFSEESKHIMERFADVFNLSYMRFQDLEKAEAQAREAQIEAALERVRAQAMGMRQSEELEEVVGLVFENLERLGINPEGIDIAILEDQPEGFKNWAAERREDGWSTYSCFVHRYDHAFTDRLWNAFEEGVPYLVYALAGAEKQRHDKLFVDHVEGLPNEKLEELVAYLASIDHICASITFTSRGMVLAWRPTPLEAEEADILRRFARVVDLTYTRVEDLQQAEAHAHEVMQQAALDRVTGEIASMRDADDLQRITPLVWRELTALGVPFFRCGVFIMNEANEEMQAFLTDPQGHPLAALHLPYTTAPTTEAAVAHWRNQQVYTDVWDRQQFIDWTHSIMAKGLIETTDEYRGIEAPPETLALHFAPFQQGMLYVGNTTPLDDKAMDAVQALADAFAVAYARYEDFQRLEAKRREVEAALAELKAAQQQLVHSEKMASLGALTAGIAHEIKNPLNFVNNFAALSQELIDELEEETDPEEIREILADLKINAEKIEEHGKRADGIVRSMLEHSRSGSGERRPTHINNLVDEYVDLAYHGKRAQTSDFNADIQKHLGKEVGRVEILPQEIGRVLINLLGNAFDAVYQYAMQRGADYAPRVTVSTRRTGNQLEIRVADNGPGIPDDVREKIFEPFFTTKPTGSGTGLGLSMSYDIVTQGHGGMLTVESAEGKGSAFIVRIPAP